MHSRIRSLMNMRWQIFPRSQSGKNENPVRGIKWRACCWLRFISNERKSTRLTYRKDVYVRRVFLTADSLFGCFEWLDRLFVICSSYKIINGGIVVICKTDQHFNRNSTGTCLVVRVRTLADMKDFAKLFLGQVRINSEILNTLIFIENTSLVSISIKQTEMWWWIWSKMDSVSCAGCNAEVVLPSTKQSRSWRTL